MTKLELPDIDIDFGDRSKVLSLIKHIPASIHDDNHVKKHATGIYCQNIPYNPLTDTSSIDYKDAEHRGYFKLDFLNVNLYQKISSNQELDRLMNIEPSWHKLYDPEFCAQLIHIGNHYDTLIAMPEAVTSIERMAMLLAIIRPGKRHLIGLPWSEVAKTVWIKPADGSYGYKKSHGIAYAHLVVVHMNLLEHSTN
jgi:hypothetical protein